MAVLCLSFLLYSSKMSFTVMSGLADELNTVAHCSLPQSDDKELMEPPATTSTSQLLINGMINGQTFFPFSSLNPLLCGNKCTENA